MAGANESSTHPMGAQVIARQTVKHHGEGLARGILVTAACLGVSRCCGLGRELLVAARSGPSDAADAVYTALVFVTTATTVLALTAPNVLARVFYTRGVGAEDRRRLIWACMARWATCLGVASLAIVAFAGPLLALLTYAPTDEARAQGMLAIRIAAAILFLQGLFLPLASIGNSEGWHTPVAVLSTGFPLGGLLGVLLLYGSLGVVSLMVGILAMSAAQLGLLTWYLWSRGLSPDPGSAGVDLGVVFRELVRVAAPVVVGAALLKLDGVLMARIASGLRPGDVFLLALAGMVVNVPMSVANQAVMQTTIPVLVRDHSRGDLDEFGRVVLMTGQLTSLLIMPCAVLMVIDAQGVVGLLFERGRFDAGSVERTADVLRVWAAASPLLTLTLYMDEVLMASGARSAVATGRAATLLAMIPTCVWGSRLGALPGMVTAYVLVNVGRLLVTSEFVARTGGIARAKLWGPQAKILAGAIVAGGAAWLLGSAADRIGAGGITRLGLEALPIGVVFLTTCVCLNVEGARRLVARARHAWRGVGWGRPQAREAAT